MIPSRERIHELVMAIATANGVMRVDIYRGRSYAEAEKDYQAAIKELDDALDLVFPTIMLDCDMSRRYTATTLREAGHDDQRTDNRGGTSAGSDAVDPEESSSV
jgi:hypothetical protein